MTQNHRQRRRAGPRNKRGKQKLAAINPHHHTTQTTHAHTVFVVIHQTSYIRHQNITAVGDICLLRLVK